MESYHGNTFKNRKPFTDEATQALLAYDWPGNIRELISVAEYCYYAARDKENYDSDCLPADITSSSFHGDEERKEIIVRRYGDNFDNFDSQEKMILFKMLTLIESNKTQPIGRNVLLKMLNNSGVSITEGIAKRYLKILKSRDLIIVGKTKQGTVISTKGKKLLDLINQGEIDERRT